MAGLAGDGVLDAGGFLGFFTVVPALEATYEIAGDAAEALKENIVFDTAAGWAAISFDDTGKATDRVAIDRMVDGAIADASFLHVTDDGFKGFDVVGRIAV